MDSGFTHVFCGKGDGKSSAALGKGLLGASNGKKVIIIRFFKTKNENEMQFFSRLEPEIKFFRFEKSKAGFESLSEEQKEEEKINIKNGLNFAKKVLTTGESDILILDEVLDLIDEGILSEDELTSVLKEKSSDVVIYMTGTNLSDNLNNYVDIISKVESLK